MGTATAEPVRERAPATDISPAATSGLSARALCVLLLGFGLSIVDFFVVNVALPTMGRDLDTSAAELELVVSAYGLAYALLLVFGGRLGDAIGRRRLFVIGMAAFTVTSLLCGLAPSILALIIARAVQGAAAALMVPQVLASIHATLDGRRHARAIGMYGATAGLAMVAGQLLGGLIVSANVASSGWRGIFLVNVPIGLFALLALTRSVPETRSEDPARIDRRGTALLAGTLLCLLLPLTEGRALGWPWWSFVVLALAPIGAAVLARHELALEARGGIPLVPPAILRVASVKRGLAVVVPFFASFGGFMFVYALVSQEGLGLTPIVAGAVLAPFAVAFFSASLLTARLVRRFGKGVLGLGAALQCAGLLGLALALASEQHHPLLAVCLPLLVVVGFGQGLVVSPMFRTVLSEVPGHLAGAGTGVLTTTQQSALALGVALLGALYAALVPSLGFAGAASVILALQAGVAASIVVAARGLPALA